MNPRLSLLACVLALTMAACGPSPTETPTLTTPTPNPSPPGVPRLVTPIELATNTPLPSPTPLTETPEPTSLPTARAHLYDDVDEGAIMAAVFPGLTLTPDAQGYQVDGSPDWIVWLNDRDEGRITQPDRTELVVIIANQVGPNPPKEELPYGASSDMIVILESLNGKLTVTQRATVMPQMSPLSSDVRIERTVDPTHEGQDDLLVTTNAVQSLVIHTEAHLYRWQGGKFVELWHGPEQDDNTAAVNQAEYSSYEATVEFADLDGDGVDEIVSNGQRTSYAKDADGRADLTAPTGVTEERSVYDWNGEAFVLDTTLSTPAPSSTTTTP
jgi:hypothetical protein